MQTRIGLFYKLLSSENPLYPMDIHQLIPDLSDLIKTLAAAIIVLPVGWQREHVSRSAGLRTYPLVAATCCVFMLVGISAIDGIGNEPGQHPDSYARLIAGIMTGLGFLGGGAILKHSDKVRGTATAITLWGTGSVGVACSFDRFDLAILLTVLMFISLVLLKPLKDSINTSDD